MGARNETILYGTQELLPYLQGPLLSLGLAAKFAVSDCAHLQRNSYLSISFARSQQGQRALWPVVEHSRYRERLQTRVAPLIDSEVEQKIIELAQLKISEITWFGSGLLRTTMTGEFIDLNRGVQREGMWTIDHCETSIFENEVRAAFDLPLGDISLRHSNWMTTEFSAPHELDMFRPYLHLCARNPRYKFHHYSSHEGVVSLSADKAILRQDLEHAVDYLEGVINE